MRERMVRYFHDLRLTACRRRRVNADGWRSRALRGVFLLGALAGFLAAFANPAAAASADTGKDGAAGSALLRAARQALADGVPEVAAEKLRELLRGNLDPGDVRAATALLARARLEAGDAAGALAAVDALPALRGEPGAADDPEVSFWRAQALAALGHWGEAAELFGKVVSEAVGDNAEVRWRVAAARFRRAEALLALGHNDEAKRALTECERDDASGPFRAAARLRLIALALDAGAPDEAAARLAEAERDPIPGETRLQGAERRLLAARLALARRDFAAAETALDTLRQERASLDERLFSAVVFTQAEVRVARGDFAGARAALVGWIEAYPRSPFLAEAFARLETLAATMISAGTGEQEIAADFARWERDTTAPDRQARAALALARARREAGQLDAAEALLGRFDETFANHPLRARARLELAAVQVLDGLADDALASIAATRALLPQDRGSPASDGDLPTPAEIDLLEARAHLARGDLSAAARLLSALSQRDTALAEPAALAAALTRLRAGDEAAYAAAREAFMRRFPQSPRRAELPLEEGLIRAAHALAANDRESGDDPRGKHRLEQEREMRAATDALRQFLSENPTAPRRLEARLALAELALLNKDARGENGEGTSSPRTDNLAAAREEFGAVSTEISPDPEKGESARPPEDAAAAERADYLAIWLADAPGPSRDENGALAAAKKFLARWPGSSRLAEARLKLGELYFRREDYADAQTQLELIPRGESAATLALFEHARYLAGLAALRSLSAAGADRAVSLFEDAARVNGALKTAARLRQAETLRDRLGKPADALRIYESLLAPSSSPSPSAATSAPSLTKTAGDRTPDPSVTAFGAGLGGPAKATPAPASAPTATMPAADTLENRCAALCGKGETLLVLGRPGDAAATFAALAALPGAGASWRRQAFARRGEALEKTGDNAAALAAYYDALGVTSADGGDKTGSAPSADAGAGVANGAQPATDFTWFYRAGFAAARLLKNESRWSSAAAIYTKLLAAGGPLGAEVEAQLNQLRLEHFLWPE